MPQYRAAIVTGPRGPFAIVELTKDQQLRLSTDDRQQVARCFKEQHPNLPVVFVTASPSTLHAIHGFEVTDELQACINAHHPAAVPWTHFDHQPGATGPN